MTPSRFFLCALILCTCLLGFSQRPTFPTSVPPLAASLPHIPTTPQRQSVLGYEREKFGDWAPALIDAQTCTTRTKILLRDAGTDVGPECAVSRSPSAGDPYTGRPYDSEIHIDHVYPLRAAWDLGAHAWPPAQQQSFANDPINLIAVSAKANQDKSDALPSQWMPETLAHHCWYARKVALVAATYQLPLPEADLHAMKKVCLVSEFPVLWIG